MNEDRWFGGKAKEGTSGLVIEISASRAVQQYDTALANFLKAAKTDQGEICFRLQDGAFTIAKKSVAAKIASDKTQLELCKNLVENPASLIGQFLWLRHRVSKKILCGEITRLGHAGIYFDPAGNRPIADLNDLLSANYDIVLAKDRNDADDIIKLLYS